MNWLQRQCWDQNHQQDISRRTENMPRKTLINTSLSRNFQDVLPESLSLDMAHHRRFLPDRLRHRFGNYNNLTPVQYLLLILAEAYNQKQGQYKKVLPAHCSSSLRVKRAFNKSFKHINCAFFLRLVRKF